MKFLMYTTMAIIGLIVNSVTNLEGMNRVLLLGGVFFVIGIIFELLSNSSSDSELEKNEINNSEKEILQQKKD